MPRKTVFLLILSVLVLAAPSPAHASFLDNLISKAQKLIDPPQESLSVDQTVELASGGDLNNNKAIDSGDTITFTYIVHNPTSTTYPFALLRTNCSRKELNFIHNIKGTSSLSDTKDSIDIPNLYVKPNQDTVVSFDARVNFFDDTDHTLSTQPVLTSNSQKQLFSSHKMSIKAKSLSKGHLPSLRFVQKK